MYGDGPTSPQRACRVPALIDLRYAGWHEPRRRSFSAPSLDFDTKFKYFDIDKGQMKRRRMGQACQVSKRSQVAFPTAQMMQSSVAAAGLPRGSPLRPGCSRDPSALTANVGVWAAIVGDGNGLRTKSTMWKSKSKSPSAAGEQLSKERSEIWVVLMHTLHPFGGRG